MMQQVGLSLLATFAVCIVPVAFLQLLPTIFGFHTKSGNAFGSFSLNVMLSFAAGSLVGDAVLHLLGSEVSTHHVSASAVLMGIFAFFVMDKITRSFSDGCSHSHEPKLETRKNGLRQKHSKDTDRPKPQSGYISLIADAFHNFTDGLAIAASFNKNTRLGLTTTAAIFFHEVPHEIGDYAVLVKSGFSHAKAVKLQLFTALAAFLGCICGLLLNAGWLVIPHVDEHALLPFTAGGFIYVALCTILSEVLVGGETLPATAATIGAFAVGISMMLIFD